ncbi:MAG: phosphodiester glycosidase family protein [Gemmatimonadota bacterium]
MRFHRPTNRSLGTALLLGILAACSPPDRPSSLPRALPDAVDSLLVPDSSRVIRVAEGAVYRYVWSPRGPWAVHLLEVDLARCRLGIEVAAAGDGARQDGRSTVTALAEARGPSVIAAVNGDFFTPEGRPLGPEVAAGVRGSGRERPAVVFRAGFGLPWIGTTSVSAVEVGSTGWPLGDLGPRSTHVIGGYPELLDRGRRVGDLAVASNPSFAASRHPRTAVGISDDDGRMWWVVVDGRQGDYSTGMTLPELTDLLEALGVEEALNLDGGGSSVMVLRGRSVSRPSDETGERPVANALLLVEDAAYCPSPAGR